MNIFVFFKKVIHSIIIEKYPKETEITDVRLEYPNVSKYGDMSSNIAILLANKVSIKPQLVAEEICIKLRENQFIKNAEGTKSGFINLTLEHEFWAIFLNDLLSQGNDYPTFPRQDNSKINVEFVSANPTGPLHIGHAKSAVIGDVIVNLLTKYGYNVTKEYYINDAGRQISKLIKSVDIRYRQLLGETIDLTDECYPGEYLIDVATKLLEKCHPALQAACKSKYNQIVETHAVSEILKLIKEDLKRLGVIHDEYISEREIMSTGNINNLIKFLREQNLVYEGILDRPKGGGGTKTGEWEQKKQLIFKATRFNDDSDRVILKSDGTHTYFATDMVYHLNKIERGFRKMILFLGADHVGYEKRIKSAVEALSKGEATLEVKICQLVTLKKDGKTVKMSKRSGNFISLKELLDEVGMDALRFGMLQKSADTVMEFDIERLQQQNKDNPIFYVQYASARSHSIMRKAEDTGILTHKKHYDIAVLKLLVAEHEVSLIKQLALYPRIIESCVKTLDPHKITYYLYDLASLFHQSWNIGNIYDGSKFLVKENKPLTQARLALIKSVSLVLRSGLELLGIKALKEM